MAPDEIGLNSHESGQNSLVTTPVNHAITGQFVANPDEGHRGEVGLTFLCNSGIHTETDFLAHRTVAEIT